MGIGPDVLMIDEGLAGLCYARSLHKKNVSFQILLKLRPPVLNNVCTSC
jgi:monoamine oxidase